MTSSIPIRPILEKLGIKELNAFQKAVLDKFFNEPSKNLILSAPTGIGKTALAEIMLLSTKGRAVYTSPLRALASQVHQELSKFEPVMLATSDAWKDDIEEIKERVIVSSYEKLDSILRRPWLDISDTKLLIIDEIHNLGEKERSEAIELIASWALENNIRIVAISATIGNLREIADWLNAEIISAEHRPVPLYEYVLYGNKLFTKDGKVKVINKDIIDIILSKGKSVLIFENTRKRAEEVADQLRAKYGDVVTFFHGGLTPEERNKIMQDVLNGKIKIVVSTTALGQGVNLPIYAVVFDEMKLPVVENGRFSGWKYMDVNSYKQIAGRAGRPRFDNEGIAIIRAKSESEARFFMKRYLNGELESITGNLSLPKFVLVKVVQKGSISLEKLAELTKTTLSLRNVTIDEIKSTVDVLANHNLLYNNGNEISSTPLGRTIAQTYVDIDDALYFLEQNDVTLEVVANAPKVIEVSRNADVVGLLRGWIFGESEAELLKYGTNITVKDVVQIIGNASWQAYTYYAILKALNDPRQMEALKLWQEVENGIPWEGVNLVKLKGIGRKLAHFLLKLGYRRKRDICNDKSKIIAEMAKDPNLVKQVWRIEELCGGE